VLNLIKTYRFFEYTSIFKIIYAVYITLCARYLAL